MPLNLYRRHAADCPHREKGIEYARCNCPIWTYGTTDKGETVRESLKTRDWKRAIKRMEQREQGLQSNEPKSSTGPSIHVAITQYLAACKHRSVAAATYEIYERNLRWLKDGCDAAGIKTIDQLELGNVLTVFYGDRELAPVTRNAEVIRLRMFWRYLRLRKWVSDSDEEIKHLLPKTKAPLEQTSPYTNDELARLLNVKPPKPWWTDGMIRELGALMELMLHTGYRIGDAFRLRIDAVDFKSGYVTIIVQKTKQPLKLKLSSSALEALSRLKTYSTDDVHFFDQRTKLGTWCVRFLQIGKYAGVHNVHAHRFRDTFAKELLAAGVPMRTVSLLLGHKSIRTTEQYYAKFVPEYQAQLDGASGALDFTRVGRIDRPAVPAYAFTNVVR